MSKDCFNVTSDRKFSFNYGVILLFIFSTYISININTFYDKKERSERELFASQLATDQDISAELEFEKVDKLICSDNYFKKIFEISSLQRVNKQIIKNYYF